MVALLSWYRLGPGEEGIAKNHFGRARGVRNTYAIGEKAIEPENEAVAGALTLDRPAEFSANIRAQQRQIIQCRPTRRFNQKLSWFYSFFGFAPPVRHNLHPGGHIQS